MLRSRLLALFLVALPATSPGHTDISETIKALTAKIAKAPTADLYYQRATEYRALRETAHAIEDLSAALTLKPGDRAATIALIQELGKSDEALILAQKLRSQSGPEINDTEATYLLAKVHHLREEHPAALALCQEIQKHREDHPTAIDLLHAGILLDLARPAEAADILKISWLRTNSFVLRNNWIDTALTANRTDDILPIIQEELDSSRFRSSWLIRRARASIILKKPEMALADLRAALLEIQPRIHPERPDLTLIADRGLVHALMGNKALAKHDLAQLQKSSLPASSYRILSEALKED